MNRLRRTCGAGRSGDEGLSLPEVLVAMLISSLIMAVAAGMFNSTLRQNKFAKAKTVSGSDARIAMEGLSRDLRVAVAVQAIPITDPPAPDITLETATKTSVTFFASRGATTATQAPNPTKVWYWVDTTARCLRRAMSPAVVAGDGTLSWTMVRPTGVCLGRGDFNLDGSALFTYYPVTTTAVPSPAPIAFVAGSVAAANLPLVAAIGVDLRVTATQYPTIKPSLQQQRITLINISNDLQRGNN